jgi:hypothetical protein
MWSPLSKAIEALGRWRLPWLHVKKTLQVGDRRHQDYLGGRRWQVFLRPRDLATAWGPREDGPWWPFHCLTLFASLDYLRRDSVGPLDSDPLPVGQVQRPEWLDASTLLFIDLPGPHSAALGAALAVQGCDLVCTFNNWPHPKGVIGSQHTLAALLRYASWLRDERKRPDSPAPIAWLCDNQRLGARKGNPGEFDNRYYIEESVLPGPNYLRERGIRRIVYLAREGNTALADLAEHLFEYRQKGFEVQGAAVDDQGGIGLPGPLDLGAARFNRLGYLLAAGGGFGATVPHPSSGG